MTYRPIEPAILAFDGNGTPFAPAYGDVYHSASGGLAQARHVFLGGTGLLGENQRWRNRDSFVILETGFGLGLNFLAAWQAWLDDPHRCQRLHFVSVEKHPFRGTDLAALHDRLCAGTPVLAPLAKQLQEKWPLPLPGMHRLHFGASDELTLTLAFGDAIELLPQLELSADALFLDGFSPAKNPDLWSENVVAQLRRLATPGATLATWAVAGEVRRRLGDADFLLEKRPGFGDKREMLVGHLADATAIRDHNAVSPPPTYRDRRIIVVGGGIAGTSITERLAARECEVTLLDAAPALASGASGNPIGIIRPLPSLDDNRLSRLIRAGYLHASRHLQALQDQGLPVSWARCGVLHLARDEDHERAQRRAIEQQAPPAEFARFVNRAEAAELAGWPVAGGGWWFPGGAWIAPPSLCQANLQRHPERMTTRLSSAVAGIAKDGALWQAFDDSGRLIAEAPRLVLAAGAAAQLLVPKRLLPVWPGRGTVSLLPAEALPPLNIVACRQGYVTPAVNGIRCAGATLSRDNDPFSRREDHVENLSRLDGILPGAGSTLDPGHLPGRTSFRPMSPDRLPLSGALPAMPAGEDDGLYVLSGFGARGLVWATLTAELLASRICGEPLPVEADLAAACDPYRFMLKPPRRRQADQL